PAHLAGAVDVVVTNPGGQSATLAAAFTYVAPAAPPPVLSSVLPSSGPAAGGTLVALSGAQFQAGATVTVGGVAATVSSVAATSIAIVTPPHAAGAADVTVSNPDGQSSTLPAAFLYVAPPALVAVSPATGSTAGGTAVTLAGSGFQAGATVSFGGAAAVVGAVTATSLAATAPAHAAGLVSVVVTNPDGQSSSLATAFTYVAPPPPPSLAGVAPTSGTTAGGTLVTLTGTGFQAGATVAFGGIGAVVGAVTATSITATTPAHAGGVVSAVVTNPDGQSSSLAGAFTYFTAVPPATGVTLTANLPSPQVAGTFVAFTAAGVGSSGYQYQFWLSADGGATFVLVQDYGVATTWTTPPSLPAGTYRVLVDVRTSPGVAFDAQASLDLVLSPAPGDPFITSLTPSSGSTSGSTTVTIAGGNFVPGSVVMLGAVPQRILSVTPTAITIVTSTAVAGFTDVSVVSPSNQAAILPGGFEYLLPTKTPPPQPAPAPLPSPLPPATGVTLTAARPSPQIAGTFVTFVAAGSGSAGYQYRFSRSADAGLTFALVQDWSAATTWTTPASLGSGTYRVLAEVRTNPGVVDAQATLDLTLSPAPPEPIITTISPRTGSTAGSTT
ncbi:MAG TPA: IPT/TIG domain-containing protein, partial [Frankiaceae bacterium]|nr:IPT/TIG domain-containing protein [Frankiaceae bacterium]